MKLFPIDSQTLALLYERGYIKAEALTVLAPLPWLIQYYPELLANVDQAIRAIQKDNSTTCHLCIHFSSIHQCCLTRIDEVGAYLPTTAKSQACLDYQGVELPPFLKAGGQDD